MRVIRAIFDELRLTLLLRRRWNWRHPEPVEGDATIPLSRVLLDQRNQPSKKSTGFVAKSSQPASMIFMRALHRVRSQRHDLHAAHIRVARITFVASMPDITGMEISIR